MVEIRLENVTKMFAKNVVAVEDFTMQFEDKNFVTIVGPSGCGKTTTLRIVAGLEEQTSGDVYFGDELVNELSPRERNVAMVFQSYALYPNMRVRDNLSFGLRLRKTPRDEIRRRVAETAKMLGIEGLLDRKPRELSGGQQQRVALGRALIREPKAFLLDEPLSNLDAKLRVYMRAELRKLQKTLGITTVYVTHDQLEAMTMSDKIVVMNNGRIQQAGNPLDVYDRPVNTFVAGFLGSPPINFMDCTLTVREDEEGGVLDCRSFSVALTGDYVNLLGGKLGTRDLVMGIRPEDVIVSTKKTLDSISAKISAIQPLGSGQIVFLECGETTLVSTTSTSLELKPSEEVQMRLLKEKMHLFDRGSRQRLCRS